MRTKNFGIEIEFTGCTRECAIEAISNYFRRGYTSEEKHLSDGTQYIKYTINDDNGFPWIIKRDRSVRAEIFDKDYNVNNINDILPEIADDYKCELVSPVLTADSVDTLLSLVDVIKSQGGMVNDTCGLHVHIDKPRGVSDVVDLAKKFAVTQDFVLKDFNVESYRIEKYCKVFPIEFIDKLETDKFRNIDEFMDFVLSELAPNERQNSLHNSARYYAMNFHSILIHNTVEFRFFNSTLDKKEIIRILDWVLHFAYSPEDCEKHLTQLGLNM